LRRIGIKDTYVEEMGVVIQLKPVRGSPYEPLVLGEDPSLQRHQVTEVLPVKPVVAEYQLHSLVYSGYSEATRAELHAGIPTGGFGPRVQAITGLCTGAYHLSKRTTQTVMADLFGVVMGLGTVAHLEHGMVQVGMCRQILTRHQDYMTTAYEVALRGKPVPMADTL
jgi:hypothetical protein